jgi:hypothetical protein
VGSKDEWKDYNDQFGVVVDQAIHDELIPDRGYLKRVFKKLGDTGTLSADADGALWINLNDPRLPGRVGLSASNIFDSDSDAQIAYQIVLARMETELNSPKHSRETMLEFRQDWAMLADLHQRGQDLLARKTAGTGAPANATSPGSTSAPAQGNRSVPAHNGHGFLP